MKRIKISVKGIEEDAWEMLKELQEQERRYLGAILSDCIRYYFDEPEHQEWGPTE